jgi:hypothetical protein
MSEQEEGDAPSLLVSPRPPPPCSCLVAGGGGGGLLGVEEGNIGWSFLERIGRDPEDELDLFPVLYSQSIDRDHRLTATLSSSSMQFWRVRIHVESVQFIARMTHDPIYHHVGSELP